MAGLQPNINKSCYCYVVHLSLWAGYSLEITPVGCNRKTVNFSFADHSIKRKRSPKLGFLLQGHAQEFISNALCNVSLLYSVVNSMYFVPLCCLGGTNTHIAIRDARQEMFTQRNGDRSDAPDVLIILTDGNSFSRRQLEEEARLVSVLL